MSEWHGLNAGFNYDLVVHLVKGEQAPEPWLLLTSWVANAATWYQYASAVATPARAGLYICAICD